MDKERGYIQGRIRSVVVLLGRGKGKAIVRPKERGHTGSWACMARRKTGVQIGRPVKKESLEQWGVGQSREGRTKRRMASLFQCGGEGAQN